MRSSEPIEKLPRCRRWTEISIKICQNHESDLWRHQYLWQWRYLQNENLGPFESGLTKPRFEYISINIWWKAKQRWLQHLHKCTGRLGNWQTVKDKKPRTISAVMIEILLLITKITPRGLIDAEVNSILFIGWLVTWQCQKHFLILYCYNNLFRYHRILNELCTSFGRAQSKDFKNIYLMKIWQLHR